MADRPAHLPPGSLLGEHYVVQGLVRLAEGSMFYLASDARPDRATRKCWECGSENDRAVRECVSCNAPMTDRRFLLATRWNEERFDATLAWFNKNLDHPGTLRPVDVFIHNEHQLFTVVPYSGEGLMLDEAAPLASTRVIDLAQRLAGTLAFLHNNGVQLAAIKPANLIIARDNSVRLFDLEVQAVHDGPVPEAH